MHDVLSSVICYSFLCYVQRRCFLTRGSVLRKSMSYRYRYDAHMSHRRCSRWIFNRALSRFACCAGMNSFLLPSCLPSLIRPCLASAKIVRQYWWIHTYVTRHRIQIHIRIHFRNLYNCIHRYTYVSRSIRALIFSLRLCFSALSFCLLHLK